MRLRKVQKEDFPEVIALCNDVFKISIPMQEAFPLLFNEHNLQSYVICYRDVIISFVGLLPIQYQHYIGASIGAVCTKKEFQGQGILGSFFPKIIQSLENSLDFILISSAGKLYRNNGSLKFGDFYEHQLYPKKIEGVEYSVFEGALKDLASIKKILDKSDSFDYGINELNMLLTSQGYAKITGQKQTTYLTKNLNSFVSLGIKNGLGYVIEYGGNSLEVKNLIQKIAFTEGLKQVVWIHKEAFENEEIKRVENQGSIINFTGVKDLPYTGGLRFI